jgi:hypothetical protein
MSVSMGVVIQPSALATIQSKFFGVPPAPTRIGMRGCWTGLGKAQLGLRWANSPSYDATSWLQSSPISSRYSRSTVRRFLPGTPWSSSSSTFQPKPTPRITRPPERWSRVASVLARVIGSCSIGSATAVPSRIVEVTVAAVASAIHGSRILR